jgi:hypothetical protein
MSPEREPHLMEGRCFSSALVCDSIILQITCQGLLVAAPREACRATNCRVTKPLLKHLYARVGKSHIDHRPSQREAQGQAAALHGQQSIARYDLVLSERRLG